MAYAKCQYCKKKLSTKDAFKVVVNNQNKYWCNEDCYKKTEATKAETVKTVKCRICGKMVDINSAFKIRINEQNKYFCSEQEWQAEEDRKKKYKEDKDKVYYLICDMFGYEIINTKFFDEWSLWNKLQSNENIYKYIRENEDYLQEICDRPFDGEYPKIRYFSAVLKNSLRDFKPNSKVRVDVDDKPKQKVQIDETIYEAPIHSLNKRRSLNDLEDMF